MLHSAMPVKAELLAPGTRVGRYYLLRRLAVGGMAELHLACAEGIAGFQKIVVVKHVLPHLALDPDFIQLFLNEARLAAGLDHPNIVQVTDIGETGGEYFYVMEYVHGRDARELLREGSKRGALPLEVALTIAIGAASALHHAHEATDLSGVALGLVHRDVSPANLLVSYDGAVKLTDFGIAKAAQRTTETIGGAVKGKIGYMSPEQCRGERVDRRSDLFALGVVLFELTTCERLFYADNDFAILNKVIRGDYEAPSERVPDYPPALDAIVRRALAGDPADRYATADDMRHDLEVFAHQQRIRSSPAVVAEWMAEVFGRPDYPRVELLSATTLDGPGVPTLVTPDRLMPATSTLSLARSVGVGPSRVRAWLVGALGLAGTVVALGAVASGLMAGPTELAEPGSAAAPPQSDVAAAGHESEPRRPPAEPPSDNATATPPPPSDSALGATAEARPNETRPPEVSGPVQNSGRSGGGKKKRKKRRRKGPKKEPDNSRNKAAPDIDWLYPVPR